MDKTQTMPWDPAEHLQNEEDMAAYLTAALEEGDIRLIMATLEDIARARQIATGIQQTDLVQENLYNPLPSNATTDLTTVLKLVRALGFRLQATTSPTTNTD